MRDGGRVAAAAVAVVLVSCVACGAWQITQQPSARLAVAATHIPLGQVPGQVVDLLSHAVTIFGWGEAGPPSALHFGWEAMIAALVLIALGEATVRHAWREILGLLAVGVTMLAMMAGFVVFGANAGIVQGRWFGAMLVGVPLVAGWVAARGAVGSGGVARIVAGVVVLGAAAVVGAFWWQNAYLYSAPANAPPWFFGTAIWQPPLGWPLWLTLAAFGLLCLVLGGLLSSVAGRAPFAASGEPRGGALHAAA